MIFVSQFSVPDPQASAIFTEGPLGSYSQYSTCPEGQAHCSVTQGPFDHGAVCLTRRPGAMLTEGALGS